jgi:hypothetical protein
MFSLYLPFNSKYLQVIWDHECLLPRIIPSSSLHNVPRRLFPGNHHHSSSLTDSLTLSKMQMGLLQEEDLNLENVYYSEMKDAGFFDSDWE